jgi:uncharacterized protein (TIGR03435 family)
MVRRLAGVALLSAVLVQSQGQTAGTARRLFAVASIKPSDPKINPKAQRMAFNKIGWEASNVRLADVLFTLNPFPGLDIRGGPDWVKSDRFDIVAKADPDQGEVTPDQQMGMVAALLEDRFKLASHREVKEVRGLALVAGKNPPKLDPAEVGEESRARSGEAGQIVFQKTNMYALAIRLSNIFHVPVADRSGISGEYDFTLDPSKFAVEPTAEGTPASRADGYVESMRAAVEGLGFKLIEAKTNSYSLVIDYVERPSGN